MESSNKGLKIFRICVSVLLSVLTIALGVLFIIQTTRVVGHFTKRTIEIAITQILPVIIVWLVTLVVSFFLPYEKMPFKKMRPINTNWKNGWYIVVIPIILICASNILSHVNMDNALVKEGWLIAINVICVAFIVFFANATIKVKKGWFIAINVIYAVIILLCIGFTLGYMLQTKHFTPEITESVIPFVYYLLPFAITALVATALRMLFVLDERKTFVKPSEEKIRKEKTLILVAQIVVATAAIVFIVVGLTMGQQEAVLKKAVNICMECIGMG